MTVRRSGTVAGLLATALLLVLAAVTPAAASSYRYWSFWQGSGSNWTYQQAGPNTYRPADGSVDGWRFGVSADSASAAKPEAAPDFAAICGGTPAVSGKKRVAVVIDYGTAAEAPSGSTPPSTTPRSSCAVLATDATSAQLLAQVAPPLRYDSNGILCAVDGYPRTGCGEVVSGAAATSTATAAATGSATAAPAPAKSSKGAGWVIGAVLLLVLIGAGYFRTRRRKSE
ncbi:SCO2322 family protein [Streptacidiphilus carbonis]|jgi:cobalamin biosynthesis Mg chelatase CobN|uniref:SCO2322 family protein n=1 Tax=Streptacidiphilus carbonis TaxID=105422 RepID=UPI0005A8F67D|nr:SCO2322 family protein [Streptacidiphilus carbonis]